MSEWQPIETAPKDGTGILLYWPSYTYEINDDPCEHINIGWWKSNYRLCETTDMPCSPSNENPYPCGTHLVHNVEKLRQELKKYDLRHCYFSDADELDDYGLAVESNAPTHWMPLPEPPKPE